MPRLFGNIRVYGNAATALMMEEKPSTEGAGKCEVYRMDKELFKLTGEVKKLEDIRTEQPFKAQRCKNEGSRLSWLK